MTNENASFEAKLREWRQYPHRFAIEAIGIELSNQQEEFLRDVGYMARARYLARFAPKKMSKEMEKYQSKLGISIRSGKGLGKDMTLAIVYIWALVVFPSFKGLVTAPTEKQLKDVLWSEIGKWVKQSKAELWRYIKVTAERAYVDGCKTTRFISYRTAKVKGTAEEQAETLQGYHDDFMILAVDEASGVPDPVFKPLYETMSGFMNFSILISNPTRNTGEFYDSHNKHQKLWIRRHWDAEESNIDVVHEGGNLQAQIERMEAKYGRGSNPFKIAVTGDFPTTEDDALIPLEWIHGAVNRDIVPEAFDPLFMGVDVGRGGDKSICLGRHGGRVEFIEENNQPDTVEVARWAADNCYRYSPTMSYVDVIGVGAGVFDMLNSWGNTVIPVNVAESSSRKDKYQRLRDELWWKLREAFEEKRISIPDDDELISELSMIKYDVDAKGVIKIMSKAEMKKRGLGSPNKADALCMTYYLPDSNFRQVESNSDFQNALDPVVSGW